MEPIHGVALGYAVVVCLHVYAYWYIQDRFQRTGVLDIKGTSPFASLGSARSCSPWTVTPCSP